MKFTYDLKKSQSNKEKHGVDFEEAQKIWVSGPVIMPTKSVDEPRWVAIGSIDIRVYTAVFTMRGDTVRIISCRPARTKEKEAYHG